ncbi:MAG TPA: hypothetical protein VMR76_03055 [Candidatus Saccharimonadia bacterium]|nr:hypothetical protein [Candidatus Saccharimonadia bacterium]
MKKNDITFVVSVMIVGAIVAVATTSSLIVKPNSKNDQVETISVLKTSFQTPNSSYFNSQSIDPTQLITIGGNANGAPFSNSN